MKKNDVLYVSKSLYKIYGITNFRVFEIIKEEWDAMCIFINGKSVWLPKSQIYREKPAYLKGMKK